MQGKRIISVRLRITRRCVTVAVPEVLQTNEHVYTLSTEDLYSASADESLRNLYAEAYRGGE